MSKHILELAQMRRLKELGLELGDTVLWWQYDPLHQRYELRPRNSEVALDKLPAYTLMDIIDKLPKRVAVMRGDAEVEYDLGIDVSPDCESVSYVSHGGGDVLHLCGGQSLIDAAYEMLCWWLESTI